MGIENVVTAAKSELSWLQRHERIVLIAIVLLAGTWGWNKWIDNDPTDKRVAAAVLAQQVTDLKAANAEIALQATQSAAQYQATVDALSKQNASLAAAVAARQATLVSQQAKNTTAPLPELAQRWESLVSDETNVAPGGLTATADGITVTDTAARATVNMLEEVPVLKSDLSDETEIATNRGIEVDKANGLIGVLNTQVSSLKTLGDAADKKCAADIAVVKSEARKSKRNWFLKGAGVGATVALYIVLHL